MKSNQEIEKRIDVLKNILELHENLDELKSKIPTRDYQVIANSQGEWFIISGYSPSLINILAEIKNKVIKNRVSDFNKAIKNFKLLNKYLKCPNLEDKTKIKLLNPNILMNIIYSYCWIFNLSEWGAIPVILEELPE
jgi:hypothetical protein